MRTLTNIFGCLHTPFSFTLSILFLLLSLKTYTGSGIPVASVAAGFPAGQTPLKQRLEEIEYAVKGGAAEIDIVITRPHVLNANWKVCVCVCVCVCVWRGTGEIRKKRDAFRYRSQ